MPNIMVVIKVHDYTRSVEFTRLSRSNLKNKTGKNMIISLKNNISDPKQKIVVLTVHDIDLLKKK